MSEKELDLLLDNHARLRGKANVDQADFVAIFSGAILAAREAQMNQDALDANRA